MKKIFGQLIFKILVLATIIFPLTLNAQDQKLSPDLQSLVESERSFAKLSVQKGIRESFLTYFADDCISFTPDPGNAKERLLKRPPLTSPSPVTLNWEPLFADVSRSGNFGCTTGPFSLTDNTPKKNPTQYGYYFSVWKKQSDGTWKVALDIGILTPTPQEGAKPLSFRSAKTVAMKTPKGKINLEKEQSGLLAKDKDFFKAAASESMAKAYLYSMGEETRLHRDGMFPVTDRDSIESYFLKTNQKMIWEPSKAEVAPSADLGYTMGSYEIKGEGSNLEKGYYVRLWKRNNKGEWKIALDTTHPLPPQ